MDLVIKESAYTEVGLSFEQFLYLLSLKNRVNDEEFKSLMDRKFIKIDEDNRLCIDAKGYNAVIEVQRLSSIKKTDLEILEDLAKSMAELFPRGRKARTNKYWRGNSALVVKKLNGFLRKYGSFRADVILQATDNYVKSFGYDTSLMRILPYFIEKDGESDLLTFIENLDEEGDDAVFEETIL